jgi:hypothetical protein
MGALLGFGQRHVVPIIGIALAAGATAYGFVSGANEIRSLLLPPWGWQLVGVTLFVIAVLAILFHWDKQQVAREKDEADEGVQLDAVSVRPDSLVPDSGFYEGAHETLMNFVVEHVVPVCDARNRVHGEIIRALCPNGLVAELAQYGASQFANADQLRGGMEALGGLADSPPKFIPFDEMCWAVGHIEYGYDAFLLEGVRIANSGYVHPRVAAIVAELWEKWRIAHNAMVAAYEPIKRNSKMGSLFRPVRESMWGGNIPPSTNGRPIPLKILEPI